MNRIIPIILCITTSGIFAMDKQLIPESNSIQKSKAEDERTYLYTHIPIMNTLPKEIQQIIYQYANTSECITKQIFPTPLPTSKRCLYCLNLQNPDQYQRLYLSNLSADQAALIIIFSSYQDSVLKEFSRSFLCKNLIEQIAANYGIRPEGVWQVLRSFSKQEQLLLMLHLVEKFGDTQLSQESLNIYKQLPLTHTSKKVGTVTKDPLCTCTVETSTSQNQQKLNFARSALL